MKRTGNQTQWAGQFGVAHELARRGYLVSFTLGNAPVVDLLCISPKGHEFSVQVKSLKSKNYFIYQTSLLELDPNLYFVFVLIPPISSEAHALPVEYFVLNNEQFHLLVEEENQRQKEEERKRGKPYAAFAPSIYYRTLNRSEFRNAWHNLPV
jgi:hypothetical protein